MGKVRPVLAYVAVLVLVLMLWTLLDFRSEEKAFIAELRRSAPLPAAPVNFTGFNNETGAPGGELIVPNMVHYVRFDLPEFNFIEFICILSALQRQRPDRLLLHTNLNNFTGRYWDKLLARPGVKQVVQIYHGLLGIPLDYRWNTRITVGIPGLPSEYPDYHRNTRITVGIPGLPTQCPEEYPSRFPLGRSRSFFLVPWSDIVLRCWENGVEFPKEFWPREILKKVGESTSVEVSGNCGSVLRESDMMCSMGPGVGPGTQPGAPSGVGQCDVLEGAGSSGLCDEAGRSDRGGGGVKRRGGGSGDAVSEIKKKKG